MNVRPSARLKTLSGRFGPVTVSDLLGYGGMAAVYRATRGASGEECALKVLSREEATENQAERFEREGRIGRILDHESIVNVYEAGEERGYLYLVMTLVEGGDLKERVQRHGPLPWREAAEFGASIAEALAHAHSHGVIHRDLKPANVMVTLKGEARLADFGLAMILGEGPHRDEDARDGLAMLVGTPAYMAPEQFRRPNGVDSRADLYGLGCILYELLAGERPFPEETVEAIKEAHERREPTPLTKRRDDLPPLLVSLVERLMAKNPSWRYEQAATAASDLREILAGRLEALTDEESRSVSGSGERLAERAATVVASTSSKRSRGVDLSRFDLGRILAYGSLALILLAFGGWFVSAHLHDSKVNGHVTRGQTLLSEGRYDEAIAAFEEALTLDPERAAAIHGIEHARLLIEMGDDPGGK